MSFKIKCSALFASVLAVSSMVATPMAYATDNAVGTIATMDVTAGSNYALRVSLTGGATMCTGGPSWAYLNDTDSNYKVYAAALMLAKAQGTRVTVYSLLENGYCHIVFITVQSS